MKKLALLTTLIFAVITVTAQVIHVPADQASIQEGIDASADGDTVLVAEGTYLENINFDGKAITLASQFLMDGDTNHITNTIIDGSDPDDPNYGSVVLFESGEDTTSILCGFTITGGSGTSILEGLTDAKAGGGIMLNRSGAKLQYNYIEYNEVLYDKLTMGGGLTAGGPITPQPLLILIGNKIRHNKSISTTLQANGGGIEVYCNLIMVDNEVSYNEAQCPVLSVAGGVSIRGNFGHIDISVKNNLITQNKSVSNNILTEYSESGGLFVGMDCSGNVSNNIISFNEVEAPENTNCYGAGVIIVKTGPDLIFENNFITNNYFSGGSCFGGGLTIWAGGGTYQNNIIQNNSGTYGGGVGIGFESDSTAILINNTITGNEAFYGGGLYAQNIEAVVINSILWDNDATGGPSIYEVESNLEVKYSDVEGGWTGAGNMNIDPLFKNDGYHLKRVSPVANQGKSTVTIDGEYYYSPEYDFEDDERPYAGTRPDMGADEAPILNVSVFELNSAEELSINIFPNPIAQFVNIEYDLGSASFVQIKIIDQSGKQVKILVDEFKSAGKHALTWNPVNLPAGIYFCLLETENGIEIQKLVKLH